MKKKFETTDIEQYFHITNSIAPIYNEEKVHQIINRPGAKARLKGKPRNLLKITIMTTIFAVIVSAVLLWPGEDSRSQDSDSKFQVSDSKLEVSGSKFQVEPSKQGSGKVENDLTFAGTTELDSVDEMIAMAGRNRGTFEETDNNLVVSDIVQINQKIFATKLPDEEKPIDFDPSTIQPTDGSRFIMKIRVDEFRKLGFQIIDSIDIQSKNITLDELKERVFFDFPTGFPYGIVNENGYYYVVRFNPEIWKSRSEKNRTDFYPLFKTNCFVSNVFPCQEPPYPDQSKFHLVNDTLLPILFSTFNQLDNEIFWFVSSDEMYKILEKNHKPALDEFKKYKSFKKHFPSTDLILYQAPFSIDESKILKLGHVELENIGFRFFEDSINYQGRHEKFAFQFYLRKKGALGWKTSTKEYGTNIVNSSLAILVTRKDGSPISKGLLPYFTKNTDGELFDIPHLIPVLVKTGDQFRFYREIIFWFLPTEGFFNDLPYSIGNDLRKEYNYITATDKSTLVKPVCKYFDECKNTLAISNFKVFPNPASHRVTVSFELPDDINGRITLVDLSGRERQVLQPQSQFTAGPHQFDFDLSSVAEGIYLLTLYSDKGVQTQRLMVVR
jgi:hypothetical protein